MKWYFILLIAFGALALGLLIAKMTKSKDKVEIDLKSKPPATINPLVNPKGEPTVIKTQVVDQVSGADRTQITVTA